MIDLVSKRLIFLGISLLVIIPGLIALFAGGIKPAIDFTGGTRWEVIPLNAAANSPDKFKATLAKAGYQDAVVKATTLGTSTGTVVTNTIEMDLPGAVTGQKKADLEQALINDKLVAGQLVTDTVSITPTGTLTSTGTPLAVASTTPTGTGITSTVTVTGTTGTAGGTTAQSTPQAPATKTVTRYRIVPSSEVTYTSVGPTVGSELLGRAMLAILAAAVAILIYLTVVFRKVPNSFRYGVCAVIALLHDVLVVVGVFAILGLLFGEEVDALFITAMLTVIGFSVHDTIVVFDRVRENIMRRRFERFEDVVNYSLVQTLARSINTSITVLITLFALYLFGGATIRSFVLALLIGIISGTYSSIFNASMLLVIWENRDWGRLSGRGETTPSATRTATTR
ncbi:MAG: protein translocase subunit SecF [Chloroflexi bacterium]|nr:protein translocase subunit SecF [Chloroflexota bacterium]